VARTASRRDTERHRTRRAVELVGCELDDLHTAPAADGLHGLADDHLLDQLELDDLARHRHHDDRTYDHYSRAGHDHHSGAGHDHHSRAEHDQQQHHRRRGLLDCSAHKLTEHGLDGHRVDRHRPDEHPADQPDAARQEDLEL
jgi:hypothetical protein